MLKLVVVTDAITTYLRKMNADESTEEAWNCINNVRYKDYGLVDFIESKRVTLSEVTPSQSDRSLHAPLDRNKWKDP